MTLCKAQLSCSCHGFVDREGERRGADAGRTPSSKVFVPISKFSVRLVDKPQTDNW